MKKYRIIIVAVICFLIMLYAKQVHGVNEKFPQPDVLSCEKGESLQFNEFEYKVLNVNWLNKEEIKKQVEKNFFVYKGDYRAIIIDLEVKNITKENQTFDGNALCIEGPGFENGIAYDYYFDNEEDNRRNIELKPQESGKIKLVYTLPEEKFTKADWTDIENKDFKVIAANYPKRVELNLQ